MEPNCDCWKHRYHVVHVVGNKIYDHSQGTWDADLRGLEPEQIQNIPSRFYQHGDTAETLLERYYQYLVNKS